MYFRFRNGQITFRPEDVFKRDEACKMGSLLEFEKAFEKLLFLLELLYLGLSKESNDLITEEGIVRDPSIQVVPTVGEFCASVEQLRISPGRYPAPRRSHSRPT